MLKEEKYKKYKKKSTWQLTQLKILILLYRFSFAHAFPNLLTFKLDLFS